ncbi:MAG: HYR domain-containing protein, partial [Crocinitomicaceae bacterium]
MKKRLTLTLKAVFTALIFFPLYLHTNGQVTVEFRILEVSSDIDDMDAADDSDPTWNYQVTDVPFANVGAGTFTLPETNCPPLTAVNDLFFSQTYNCTLPTSYDFVWEAYEDDGTPLTSDAYTNPQTEVIPAGSIAYPNNTWTTLGTYSATAAGTDCGLTGTVTWGIVLQYRTFGTTLDATDPTVTFCPVDVTDDVDPGLCTATIDPDDPTFSDNCAVTEVTWAMTGATVASSPGTGINFIGSTVFNTGTTTISYTASDAEGNSVNSCSFDVTVNDTENPTITCPADITVSNDAGDCGAVVNYVTPTGADNCPGST